MCRLEDYDAFELGGLLVVVSDLAQKSSIDLRDATFGRLAYAMFLAGTALQTLEEPRLYTSELDGILKSLTRLCNWRTTLSSRRIAQRDLCSLLMDRRHQDDAAGRSAFDQCSREVKANLLAFGADAQHHRLERYRSNHHFLDQFMQQLQTLARLETAPPKEKPPHTPEDYPTRLNDEVHTLLKARSSCSCSFTLDQGIVQQGHLSRLSLSPEIRKCDDNVIFDVAFSAQAFEHWQRIRLLAPRSDKDGLSRKVSGGRDGSHSHSEVKDGLCKIINSWVGPVYHCLQIRGHEISEVEVIDPEFILQARASISLTALLQRNCLTGRMKAALAWTLAHSVWRFYNSRWMSTRWSADSIHFMREDESPPLSKVNAARPCLVVCFDGGDDDDGNSEYYDARGSVVHHYPRILSLGKLLVDIGRETVPAISAVVNYQSRAQQINTDYVVAKQALKNKDWPYLGSLRHGRESYRAITTACFDKKLFDLPPAETTNFDRDAGEGTHQKQDAEERRAIIYERIVRPIEDLIRESGWQGQLHDMESIDVTDSDDEIVVTERQVPKEGRSPHVSSEGGSLNQSSGQFLAANVFQEMSWLNKLKAAYQPIFISYPRYTSMSIPNKTRIAVLDTGYDATSGFFLAPHRNRQLHGGGWYDFVEQESSPVDLDGHGTQVLSLLMTAAPYTRVFVARVARNSDNLDQSGENISKAIKFATDKDKWNVDIVVMSLGFPPDSPAVRSISNAINGAIASREGKLLIFAAAGNKGANEPMMFPANHSSVIPIFGTDDSGVFQESINPPLTRDQPSVFGTLALDVPCIGLCNQGEITKSGTSFATPIAAGTAAMILEHAKMLEESDQRHPKGRSGDLKTKRAMLSMFRAMAGGRETNKRRYYLNPSKFFIRREDVRWSTIVYALEHQQ